MVYLTLFCKIDFLYGLSNMHHMLYSEGTVMVNLALFAKKEPFFVRDA